ALIGNEGDGWKQVNAELAFERSGPERIYSSAVLLEQWLEYLRRCGGQEQHAQVLGRFATHLAALRHLCIAVTAKLVNGESPIVEAALVKDLGTAFEQEAPVLIENLMHSNMDKEIDEELLATV